MGFSVGSWRVLRLVPILVLVALFAFAFSPPHVRNYPNAPRFGAFGAAADLLAEPVNGRFLPLENVRAGIAHAGSLSRLSRLAARLLDGESVEVVAVGGSTTAGAGSPRGNVFHKRFGDWLNATFPNPKDGVHSVIVNALGGTPSSLFNACSDRMVTSGGDLYIIEFALNDPALEDITGPTRRGFEQLLRKVLRMPGEPAVIILNQMSYGASAGVFYKTADDKLATIATYYDVPVLSMRNAVWSILERPGFWVNDSVANVIGRDKYSGLASRPIFPEELLYLSWDGTHPSDQTGQRVLSELLEEIVRWALKDAIAGTGPIFHPGRQLLPPMFAGNYEANSSRCFLEDDLLALKTASDRFNWSARKPAAKIKSQQQWSLVAESDGAWVEFDVSTQLAVDGATSEAKATNATLVLAYVRSWGNYGDMLVECVVGCRCEPTVLPGKWDFNNTQTAMGKVDATQAADCRLRATAIAVGDARSVHLRGVLIVESGTHLYSREMGQGDAIATRN